MLISWDNGPYNLFASIRSRAGLKASSGNIHWRNFAELLICPYCLGIWLALLIGWMVLMNNQIFDVIILMLGIAGGQAILQSIVEVDDGA